MSSGGYRVGARGGGGEIAHFGGPLPSFSEIVHFLCSAGIIFAEFNIHSQVFKSGHPLAEGLNPPLVSFNRTF